MNRGLDELIAALRDEIAHAEECGYEDFPMEVGTTGNPVVLTLDEAKALLACLTEKAT